ncbi:DUF6484 domain-containing protein [Aliikangiella sp. IMCC44359]|uniref:DUF6484 domain-containing protein n=1 Tax=Aliikangiella sp. IMCC44359 TaxID=3459125 RepID=UPI00403ABB15
MSEQSDAWPEQEVLLEEQAAQDVTPVAPGEIIIGELLGFNDSGEPLITYTGASHSNAGIAAMSTVAITHEHKGRQLALLFANGDLTKPVIMGVIHSPLLEILSNVEFVEEHDDSVSETTPTKTKQDLSVSEDSQVDNNEASIDGNRVVLEGKEEIVLKCGDSSITLTKAGKILIRGKYLLNRSTGVNRIMGGSVQVN